MWSHLYRETWGIDGNSVRGVATGMAHRLGSFSQAGDGRGSKYEQEPLTYDL